MKKKDYLIVALAPLPVLSLPLWGVLWGGWKWPVPAFILAWTLLAAATFVYRLLATSRSANLFYKLGVGLAVVSSFLMGWANLAAGIIGEDNPANGLYFLVILGALGGVAASRFRAAGLAWTAFGMAACILLIPSIAYFVWPVDFSPGVPKVFALSGILAAIYVVSGLLLRHAARRAQAGL